MGKLQRQLEQRLTLWVRQLAWLHATPKPDPRSRRGKVEPDTPRPSRIEKYKARKIEPRMPPNPAPHLTDWLFEIGVTEPGGMGGPISWQTVDAWKRGTSVPVEPWVARLLKRLSVAYHAEARRAEIEACPPPWRTAISAREREADEEALRAVLG